MISFSCTPPEGLFFASLHAQSHGGYRVMLRDYYCEVYGYGEADTLEEAYERAILVATAMRIQRDDRKRSALDVKFLEDLGL